MVRQERAEATRNAILDGAARAFDTAGFSGASLSDIVKEAGVTKGALYFHFTSKEALAHALVGEQFTVWRPFEEDERPGLQTVIDLLHRMALSLRDDVRVRAGIRLVIEQGSFQDPDPTPYQTWIDTVRDCLARAQGRGDVRPEVDVGEAAGFIVGCWTGLQLSSEVLTGRTRLTESTTTMWRLLLPGLVPPRRLARFLPEGSPEVTAGGALPGV
ncbi:MULTISPECIES: ScbR family autoregulator-binding transcription factor [Streptomyces]|uniref:DNA-binding transcriptional regulator, AcrR family n=2 Tax=Streptomyces TaxID=1883 RepID=A0A1I6RVX2_9ACTN|nr:MULTISPECIES: ScbR family autoregulator-binding transcription factor [Streptomyces]QKV68317.1 TetR/AcrR family transcriptional regulator [Streptomyces harbinensis]SFS68843.1 DNA-binding transcriptional regulator, AcrR family [Streptomyces harbinensis]